MEKLVLPAPAKLNLFLHLNAQREDGYHELQTIFQFIDYCDQLTFVSRKDSEISVNAKMPSVAAKNNLIVRAAKLMRQYDKKRRGIDIKLEKKIPLGSGLGGGSSNAATTIMGLNHLWGLDLPLEQLLRLGLQLGADVPVFILGQSCWAEGVGEQLTPMELPISWFIVIIPPVTVSTAEIFFDKQLTKDTPKVEISLSLLETGENNCQAVTANRYPEVARALCWLNQFATAQMTGTGGGIFARCENRSAAVEILNKLPKNLKGFVAKGLNLSPLLTALGLNR